MDFSSTCAIPDYGNSFCDLKATCVFLFFAYSIWVWEISFNRLFALTYYLYTWLGSLGNLVNLIQNLIHATTMCLGHCN